MKKNWYYLFALLLIGQFVSSCIKDPLVANDEQGVELSEEIKSLYKKVFYNSFNIRAIKAM